MRGLLALAVTAFVSVWTACAADALFEADVGQPCASDDECGPRRFVCVIGVCVDSTAQSLDEVRLEVSPPESSGYRPQQLPDPVVIGEEGRAEVRLAPTVRLRGSVIDPNGAGIASQVIAVPAGGIEGRALVVTAQAAGAGGDFALPLVEGSTYRLTVQPQDAARPPFFVASDQSIGPSPTGEVLYGAITLPDLASLENLSGRVVSGAGTAMLGVEGLEVRALSEGRRVSSVGRTLADGSFTIFLAAGADGPFVVEVRPTESNRLNPIVMVEDVYVGEGNVNLGEIPLGSLPAPVPFAGVVRGPDGEEVGSATIHLSAELGEGTFSLVLNADEDGAYDAELRPGTYEVAVVAPPDNPSAGLLTGFTTEVDATSSPTLNLPGRVLATGAVVSASQEPVSNAQVVLTRLGVSGGGADGVLEDQRWSFVAITDITGAWQKAVDPGRYRVTLLPDPAANLPRDTRVVDIDESSRDLGERALPPPAVIAGEIKSADGAPLGMSVVTAFSAFAGGEGALELGSSLTDNDGAFEILLPDLAP